MRRALAALAMLALACQPFEARESVPGTGVRPVDVWIDAGHGGRDPGNLGASRDPKQHEKQLVLAVAKAAREALESHGFSAHLVRDDDRFLTLGQRSRIANGAMPAADGVQARGRLLVSLHLNGSSREVVGTESFWSRVKAFASHAGAAGDDSAAATAVHAAIAQELGAVYGACSADRSVREQAYSVLRLTASPAVLVEMGFVSNPCQQSAMSDPERQRRMAAAIAQGVRYALAPASEGGVAPPSAFELPSRPPAEEGGPAPDSNAVAAIATLDERFDAAAFPPRGWKLVEMSPDSAQRWSREAGGVARANGQAAEAESWLVSPPLAIAPGAALAFRWAGNARTAVAVGAECRVQRVGDSHWERVWSLANVTRGPEFVWRAARVDLAPWAGAGVRVAFRVAGGRGADFLLDDVKLESGALAAR